MRKQLLKLTYLSLASAFIAAPALAAAPAEKHVAITQIVEHPALDAVRNGVKDVLKEAAGKGKIEVIKFVRFKVGEGI